MVDSTDFIEAKIEEWKENFNKKSEEKLAEIENFTDSNHIFYSFCDELDKLPEEICRANLFETLENYETSGDALHSHHRNVRKEDGERSRMGQNTNTWANRLRRRAPQVPFTPSTMRTPAHTQLKSITMNTPAGIVRLPQAITPKVQNGTNVKFRTLRPEEVAFSVCGTPVVAVDETAAVTGNESFQLVNELLHANDDQLTPQSRNIVHGMRQLIGRFRNSEFPEY